MKKIKPNELARYKQEEKESRLEPSSHEILENLNREGMVAVMRETGITFPAKEFAGWKPTKRELGEVRGVYGNVMILAHNGLLGLFQRAEGAGETYVTTHTGWFDGKIEPLFSTRTEKEKPKTERAVKRSKRKEFLDSI